MNEVATDYNAGFTSALARLVTEFGGTPLANFPPKETPDDAEIFTEASVNASGTNFTEIKTFLINKSAWPARMGDKLSFRYFFTLEPGVTPSMITVNTNFNQCATPSGITQHSGNIYAVTISCVGVPIYPGGQQHYRKEIQFRIASSGAWDPTNDWSFNGVATTPGTTPVRVNRIAVYDDGKLIWGQEPGGGDVQAPSAPATLRVTGTTSSTVALAWGAATDDVGVASYRILEGTTQVGTSATLSFTVTGLVPSTTHTYTVIATDAAGNRSAASNAVTATTTAPVPDTVAPSAPSGLAVASQTASSLTLTWTASTDNVGVTGYRIFEGTTQVGTSTTASFTATGLAASSAHTYTVDATDAAGNISARSTAATGTTSAPGTGSLKVQYRAADTTAADNQVRPHFNLVNTGTTSVALSDVTLRYWYTIDGVQPQTFSCDFTPRGSGNVVGRFVPVAPTRAGADYYVEVSFTAAMGSLAAGQSTGEIQARFNKNNWTNFNEADDYSFDPTKTGFADWNRVTAYLDGTLIWGVEPAAATSFAAARSGTGDGDAESSTASSGCGVSDGRAPVMLLLLVLAWFLTVRRRDPKASS
jgi:chitodextrinase